MHLPRGGRRHHLAGSTSLGVCGSVTPSGYAALTFIFSMHHKAVALRFADSIHCCLNQWSIRQGVGGVTTGQAPGGISVYNKTQIARHIFLLIKRPSISVSISISSLTSDFTQAPRSARECAYACTPQPPRNPTQQTELWQRSLSAAATRCWPTFLERGTTCRCVCVVCVCWGFVCLWGKGVRTCYVTRPTYICVWYCFSLRHKPHNTLHTTHRSTRLSCCAEAAPRTCQECATRSFGVCWTHHQSRTGRGAGQSTASNGQRSRSH